MDNITQVLQLIPTAIKINTTTNFSVDVDYRDTLEGGDSDDELEAVHNQFDAILQSSLLKN